MTEQLTTRAAAERCGLSVSALRRAVGRGAIPSQRVETPRGPVRMVTEQDVRDYLAQRADYYQEQTS